MSKPCYDKCLFKCHNLAEIRSKAHKRLSRTLFDETKQDRMQIFEGILFFKTTNNTNTDNVAAACWVLPEGPRANTTSVVH